MREFGVNPGWSTRDEELLLRAMSKSDLSSYEIWRAVSSGSERVAMTEADLLPALRSLTTRNLIIAGRPAGIEPVRRRYRIMLKGQEVAARASKATSWMWETPRPEPGSGSVTNSPPGRLDLSFDPAVGAYSASVASALNLAPGLATAIRQEIEEHLADSAGAVSGRVAHRDEAIRQAIQSLGDPRTLGDRIARLIRTRRRFVSGTVRGFVIVPIAAAVTALVAVLSLIMVCAAVDWVVQAIAAAAGIRVFTFFRGEFLTVSATLVLATAAFFGTARGVAEFQARSLRARSGILWAIAITSAACMLTVALFAPLSESWPLVAILLLPPAASIAGAAWAWRRGSWFPPRRALVLYLAAALVVAFLPGSTFAAQMNTESPGHSARPISHKWYQALYLDESGVDVFLSYDMQWSDVVVEFWPASIHGYAADVNLKAGPAATIVLSPRENSTSDFHADVPSALDPNQEWYWVVCIARGSDGESHTVLQSTMPWAPLHVKPLVDLAPRR